MHRIQKYQFPSNRIYQTEPLSTDAYGGSPTAQTMVNTDSWFNQLLALQSQKLKNPLFSKVKGFDPSKVSYGQGIEIAGASQKSPSTLTPAQQNIAGTIGNFAEPAIQMLGAKQADNITGGEKAFSQATSLAFNEAVKTGNPIAIGITGGLKSIDLANRYLGSTAKLQGTIGLDTGGYSFNLNSEAGKKQTLLGTIGGETRRINSLTKRYDKANTQAGQSSYLNKKNLIGAQNTTNTWSQKNQQQLYGGNIDTSLLSSQKGGKISPVELRRIKQKVKYPAKVRRPVEVTSKDRKPIISPPPMTKTQLRSISPKPGFSILGNGSKNTTQFKEGGQLNVIPDGALHARKNNYEGNLGEAVTNKGIPVVTYGDKDKITQHAEIERDEIIFTKDTTDRLESYYKQYNEAESEASKDAISVECGKFLANEIMENTDDRTNLIKTIK